MDCRVHNVGDVCDGHSRIWCGNVLATTYHDSRETSACVKRPEKKTSSSNILADQYQDQDQKSCRNRLLSETG